MSRKFPPASTYRSSMVTASPSGVTVPMIMHPRASWLTCSPVRPSCTVFT
ncbi:hypothetical protein [Nonomuraea rubra]